MRNESSLFRRWFEGSKIVDEYGAPLRAYRGMTKPMEGAEFTTSHGSLGPGIYCSTDPSVASFWGGHREPEGIENSYGGVVYPLYLCIRNPISAEEAADLESQYLSRTHSVLIERGYDGIFTPGEDEIVALRPDQIWLALPGFSRSPRQTKFEIASKPSHEFSQGPA